MRVTAIYPGTFDPMTVGHIDVATRASKMFDDLIIGVAGDPSASKTPFFNLDERVDMAARILTDLPNVKVMPFAGLLVNFAASVEARVIVRGLRAISDFEYEVQIAGVNRHLSPKVETVFIAASQDYTFLSSSIVKEIAKLDGDYSDFVHPLVIEEFQRKFKS
jgi:pantetheine-phosphate adenylyltransferase